MFGLLRR
jgi:hypothetical protein